MNSLQVDPTTGFLESVNPSNSTFTAEKKIQFLELARAEKANGKFPPINGICAAIGIDARTFERHLELDAVFLEEWKAISTSIEYDCISDMSDLRKKQPLFMFQLLRYLNPKRWNPNEKSSPPVNVNIFTDHIQKSRTFIEAEEIKTSTPNQLEKPSDLK